MGLLSRAIGAAVTLGVIAGCAGPDPIATKTLHKGEPLDIRNILAAHPDEQACVDYEAASNSCAAIITSTVQGNIMISNEITELELPGGKGTQRVENVIRSVLQGLQACARSEDVSNTGYDEMSVALLYVRRDQMDRFGGEVCSSYFRSGDGYIATSVGADGQPFPPGDTKFQFIVGGAKLRAQ